MKQWLSISLSASLLFAGLAQAATPLIGVGMAKYNDNFQTILRHGVEKQVALLDADIFMENGQDDVELQMRQFRNLVNSKVDAIVVAMVSGKSAPEMMRLANEAKVPLVFVNRNPEPATWPALTAFVGSDELESGTLQMEELARRANYKGNVVILVGDPSNKSSVMRTEDVEKVVAKYPDMKVVQKKIGNWERSQAATIVIEWVKQGVDFSIIAANNDEMAIGAIMGLEKTGKKAGDYLVGGIDGTPDGLKLMAEGKMAVSVSRMRSGRLTAQWMPRCAWRAAKPWRPRSSGCRSSSLLRKIVSSSSSAQVTNVWRWASHVCVLAAHSGSNMEQGALTGKSDSNILRSADLGFDACAGQAFFVGEAVVAGQVAKADAGELFDLRDAALPGFEWAEHDVQLTQLAGLVDHVGAGRRLAVITEKGYDLPECRRDFDVAVAAVVVAQHRAGEHRYP